MVFHLTEELPEINWIKIQFTHTIKIQRNTINLYMKLKLKTYIIKYTKIYSQYLAYQIRKDSQIEVSAKSRRQSLHFRPTRRSHGRRQVGSRQQVDSLSHYSVFASTFFLDATRRCFSSNSSI